MTVSVRVFRLPDLGEGLTESEVVAWKVAAGDRIEINQVIAEVETAKAVVDLPSPFAGVVADLLVEVGVTVAVGAPIIGVEVGEIEGGAAAPPANLVGYGAAPDAGSTRKPRKLPGAAAPRTADRPGRQQTRRRAAPPVRLLARRLGIALENVDGTGRGGLITRTDLERVAASSIGATNGHDPGEPSDLIPVTGVRSLTARAVTASAFTAPHVTVFLQVDVTPTIELIDRLRTRSGPGGSRITLLTAVARAVCMALQADPSVNSRWEDAGIRRFASVHLGIAAATPRGLLVPVIRHADALDFGQLADALSELVLTARAGTTTPAAMTGGTFTISNVGVFGVEGGTPILVEGQAGILAVGMVARRPWEFQGGIALRQTVTLSLSFDHRVVDGAEGSRLLAGIAALLADPPASFAD